MTDSLSRWKADVLQETAEHHRQAATQLIEFAVRTTLPDFAEAARAKAAEHERLADDASSALRALLSSLPTQVEG